MATKKKSNNDIQLFMKNAATFIRENENHIFTEKLNKQIKKLRDISDNFNDEVRDTAIEHCEVNEKNIIIYDDKGNFMFNKENMKKYNAITRELGKKLVSFDLILTKEHVSKLPSDYKFFFQDFIESE